MKKFLREHWFLLVLIIATVGTIVVFTRAWEYNNITKGIISAPIITFLEIIFSKLLGKKKENTSDNNWPSRSHRKRKTQ